ncbi:YjcZ family sporulation protein [Cytobacillus purgationiresistens]|nr:YjcZ family sporulation protein [Cytobacillus purgationiresistens]
MKVVKFMSEYVERENGHRGGFALVVVLFILLIIIGASFMGGGGY